MTELNGGFSEHGRPRAGPLQACDQFAGAGPAVDVPVPATAKTSTRLLQGIANVRTEVTAPRKPPWAELTSAVHSAPLPPPVVSGTT